MLEIKHLCSGYGEIIAVDAVSFSVDAGELLALVGPNGAGKSTTMKAIVGHAAVKSGVICYKGHDLVGKSPAMRIAQGIAWVPEGRRLFSELTVRENLVVGGYIQARAQEQRNLERVISLLPRVGERLQQLAGSLSGGEQQMVAIARALMAEPSLLLIDELSLGLMPKVIEQIYQALSKLRSAGLAMLLVEQNTHYALQMADKVVLLESGKSVWQGTGQAALRDPTWTQRYFGIHA